MLRLTQLTKCTFVC